MEPQYVLNDDGQFVAKRDQFSIKKDGKMVLTEPTQGKWYCGFYFDENHDQYVGGPLGRYAGHGTFYDGDDEADMYYCDYLVEQL